MSCKIALPQHPEGSHGSNSKFGIAPIMRTWLIAIISLFISIDFAKACFGELSVDRSKDTIMGAASTAYKAFSIRLCRQPLSLQDKKISQPPKMSVTQSILTEEQIVSSGEISLYRYHAQGVECANSSLLSLGHARLAAWVASTSDCHHVLT